MSTEAVGGPPEKIFDRGAATRGALLQAAREVFVEAGFTKAAVTDIVARAGASVGSLYHHFDGKADLFLTLFEDFRNRQQERTKEAVHRVRDAGETDPMQLFAAGAHAYVDGCLAERDVSRLFMSGDGPPGFDRVMREQLRAWAGRTAALFHMVDSFDEALVIVLTGAMASTVSEISLSDDEADSRRLAEECMAVVEMIRNPLR